MRAGLAADPLAVLLIQGANRFVITSTFQNEQEGEHESGS